MTEIPDDIMKAANECVAQFRWNNDNRWHLFVARAIQAERESDGWQPIETAPKDEVVLLGWWDEWPQRMWTQDVGVYHDTRAGSLHSLAQFWQPLPPSPKPAAVSEGGEDE